MKRNLQILCFLLISGTTILKAQICFNPIATTGIGGLSANAICNGDFNGDGLPDFALSNGNGIEILLRNGLGGFNVPINFTTSTFISSICTADFNNDGIADLATFDYGPGVLTVYAGDGFGNFTGIPNSIYNLGVYNPQINVCATDLNNDGVKDLVVGSGFHIAKVLLGIGNGLFGAVTNVAVSTTVCGQLISKDFNNDGNMDIVSKYSLLLGNGLGGFTTTSNFIPLNDPISVLAFDANNDGKIDIATANRGLGATSGVTGDVSIYLGDGIGGFAPATTFGIGDSMVPPFFNTSSSLICSGDFNNDQNNDLAIASFKGGTNYTSYIVILLGDGVGGMGLPINIPVPNIPHALFSADLNVDSKIDLAILTKDVTTSSELSVLINCTTTGIINNNFSKVEYTISPNPTNGKFHISGLHEKAEITVMDLFGKIIFTSNNLETVADFFIGTPGVYLVNIYTQKEKRVFKLIVNE